MQTFEIRIEGTAPLLMHNVRLADKTNEFTKAIAEINSKRKKTDEDEAERSRLEWYGSLYTDTESRPIIPSDMLWACITDGAKHTKEKPTAAAGILDIQDAPLEYDGPKTADGLFKSGCSPATWTRTRALTRYEHFGRRETHEQAQAAAAWQHS